MSCFLGQVFVLRVCALTLFQDLGKKQSRGSSGRKHLPHRADILGEKGQQYGKEEHGAGKVGEGIQEKTQERVVSRSKAQISGRTRCAGWRGVLTGRTSRFWHNWVLLTWGHQGKNQSEQMKSFDLLMSSFLCFLQISRIFLLTIICSVPILTEPLGPRTPSCALTWSCWGRHTWTRWQHSPPAPCPSTFSPPSSCCTAWAWECRGVCTPGYSSLPMQPSVTG